MERYTTVCDCSCADHTLSEDGNWCWHEDVTAVEAERDLYRWRCEQIVARLEPGPRPNGTDPKYNPSKMPPLTEYNLDCVWHSKRSELHAAALEIMAARPKENE